MRVVFSDEARADLRAIGDYIARDNPRRALRFVELLEEKAQRIGDTPDAFQLVPRYEHFGIRRRPVGNYIIFYRNESNCVYIVHVLHGARDYEALLFED